SWLPSLLVGGAFSQKLSRTRCRRRFPDEDRERPASAGEWFSEGVGPRPSNLVAERAVELWGLALDAQLWLLQKHRRVGCYAVRQPHVRADDGVVADDGIAAQDGCVGVDDHLVFQRRVPLPATDDVARGVARERQRPQRHALIQFDVPANVARL